MIDPPRDSQTGGGGGASDYPAAGDAGPDGSALSDKAPPQTGGGAGDDDWVRFDDPRPACADPAAAEPSDPPPSSGSRGSRWSRWRRPALLLVCGAAVASGQAPFGLWPLALLGLIGALALFSDKRPFRDGLIFGASYFALSLHWIVEPFLVDIARHGWMAPFALIFLALGFGSFWALAFRAAAWLRAGPVGLAVGIGVVELFRAYALTGFPWNAISYIWLDAAPMQLVSVIGPHGLTLATLLALAVPIAAAKAASKSALGPSLLLLPALVGAGMWVGAAAPTVDATAGTAFAARPVVRLVQPNAAQNKKWDPEWMPVFFDRLMEMTAARSPDGARPDLVVWPETAVAYDLEGSESLRQNIAKAAGGAPVALGFQRRDSAGRFFNSLAVLSPQAEISALYDKQHLVPFGEYVPFANILGALGIRGLAQVAQQGFSAGPGPTSLPLGRLGRVLPLICYEAVFPQDLRTGGPRPDWILQITNDGWFGRFSGPYQHLAQARIRAIERRLPMVRVANTGVSAVIDAKGNVLHSLPLNEAGFLDVRLPPSQVAETPFGRTGDWPMLPVYLIAGALLLWRRLLR